MVSLSFPNKTPKILQKKYTTLAKEQAIADKKLLLLLQEESLMSTN
jgi:hypothetical protein